MFVTLLRLTLSQKLRNNIPVCQLVSKCVCVCVRERERERDEAEEVRGLAAVYRARPHLCKVHWDCQRNRNDPERQSAQLYRRQNIKEATRFTSISAEVNCLQSFKHSVD